MDWGIIGVDVGGTNTVIGIFDYALNLIEKVSIPTLKPNFPKKTDNPSEFFDKLASEIWTLAKKTGYMERIVCAGIGVPGKVDPDNGMALSAVNLGYENVPFAAEMKKRLGVPVYIDNDVRNYTRGEAVAGNGKGFKNIICLTLGTGMAAGVMIEGNIIHGRDYFAGEIGHDYVPGESAACNCGKQGCLETIASATGISRLATEAVHLGKSTILSNHIDGQLTSRDVFLACLQGDRVAQEIFEFVGKTLAYKLLTITLLLDPEAIIIGGGAASAGEFLLRPIKEVLNEHLGHNNFPIICTGSLGDSAGLFGSAQLAFTKLEQSKAVKEGNFI